MAQLVRMAELEIDPVQLAAYKALLSEEIAASIALEPGVLSLNAVSLKSAPHHIRILEVYASRQAYEAHIQTPHFLKYKTGTAHMVTALTLLDVDPILLGTKPAAASAWPDRYIVRVLPYSHGLSAPNDDSLSGFDRLVSPQITPARAGDKHE